MPDDPHEECDGHDGQEHPQSNRRVEAELGVRHGDTARGDLPALAFAIFGVFYRFGKT